MMYIEKGDTIPNGVCSSENLSEECPVYVGGPEIEKRKQMVKMNTLFDALNYRYLEKELRWGMEDNGDLILNCGKEKIVVSGTPEYGDTVINGYGMRPRYEDGVSCFDKPSKIFKKLWTSVKTTLRSKKFWSEEYKIFSEEGFEPLF